MRDMRELRELGVIIPCVPKRARYMGPDKPALSTSEGR